MGWRSCPLVWHSALRYLFDVWRLCRFPCSACAARCSVQFAPCCLTVAVGDLSHFAHLHCLDPMFLIATFSANLSLLCLGCQPLHTQVGATQNHIKSGGAVHSVTHANTTTELAPHTHHHRACCCGSLIGVGRAAFVQRGGVSPPPPHTARTRPLPRSRPRSHGSHGHTVDATRPHTPHTQPRHHERR